MSSSSSSSAERKLRKNALSALKSACLFKPYKSFANLNIGSYYAEYFQRVLSIQGETKIRVDFFDFFMYLPQRFSRVLDDRNLAELNAQPTSVVMTYSGKGPEGRLLLDFDIIKHDADGDVF